MRQLVSYQAKLRRAVEAARRSGVAGLNLRQRLALASLFAFETSKGAFRPARSPSSTLIKFLDHVQQEFIDSPTPLFAVDYRRQLLTSARRLRARPHPIEAVILYATWAEHWVNGLLITRAIARGRTPRGAERLVRNQSWQGKLDKLWPRLGLPALSTRHRQRLEALLAVRNSFLHYKWRGELGTRTLAGSPEMRSAIRWFEATVAYLTDYSLRVVSGPALRQAAAVFEVDVRAHLRSLYEPTEADGVPPWPSRVKPRERAA